MDIWKTPGMPGFQMGFFCTKISLAFNPIFLKMLEMPLCSFTLSPKEGLNFIVCGGERPSGVIPVPGIPTYLVFPILALSTQFSLFFWFAACRSQLLTHCRISLRVSLGYSACVSVFRKSFVTAGWYVNR